MKVCDFSFRDLDRRWIGIENKKFCKKLAKKIKMRKLLRPIFGYFYIDKEYGISLRALYLNIKCLQSFAKSSPLFFRYQIYFLMRIH